MDRTVMKDKCIREIFEKNMTNCEFRENTEAKISYSSLGGIILSNYPETNLTQDCIKESVTVKGNVMIRFANCTIHINGITYRVFNKEIKFIIGNEPAKNISPKTRVEALEEFRTHRIHNMKEIKLLKFHRDISYGISSATVIIIIIAVIALVYLIRNKEKTQTIVINNNKNRHSEDVDLKVGGVITRQQPQNLDPATSSIRNPIF